MTALKTLKDLVKSNIESYGKDSLWWTHRPGEEKRYVFPDSLKKEAIKWIKSLRYEEQRKEHARVKADLTVRDIIVGLTATEMWIMTFFNITEDDLSEMESKDEKQIA